MYVAQCSEVTDEQTIANVQCDNSPDASNCAVEPPSLAFLLDALQAGVTPEVMSVYI